jgi:hypothetical protein
MLPFLLSLPIAVFYFVLIPCLLRVLILIRELLIAEPDTGFILTWKPLYADVANSGEIGYTYGTYDLSIKDPHETRSGTYASIWKQDSTGNWKFVLDTGNPGLKPKL